MCVHTQKTPQLLTDDQLIQELLVLNSSVTDSSVTDAWKIQDGTLYKCFYFSNFREAFASLCVMAMIAESMDHHPHITQSWNMVAYRLQTHSCQGISKLDFLFAAKLEQACAKFTKQ